LTDGSDLEWLGLHRVGPGHWTFELTPALSRFDGKFYGGTGIAISTAVMEAESGRPALWTSTQFVASGLTGDRFDCRVEILAEGRRTSQTRVSGWHGDRLVFTALGAAGERRPGLLEAQFGDKPDVPHPESCPPWLPKLPMPRMEPTREGMGWLALSDARMADESGAMWLRLKDRSLTRSSMAFLADMVPSGVVRAAGRLGAGTSLDNTMRYAAEPDDDWMLIDVDPQHISGGYLHGAARVWSPSGALMAIASQTAGLVMFD
jgi:acyl-CoA thioesterase